MTRQYNGPVDKLIVVNATLVQNNEKIFMQNCLVDTGSQMTLMRKKYAKKLKTEKNKEKISIVNCADQNITSIDEIVVANLSFQNTCIENVTIGIIEENDKMQLKYDCIIGLDSLTGTCLYIGEKSIQINSIAVEIRNVDSQGFEIDSLEIENIDHKYCNFDCTSECLTSKSCTHNAYAFENSVHIQSNNAILLEPLCCKKISVFSDKPMQRKNPYIFTINWKLQGLLEIIEIFWENDDITGIYVQNPNNKIIFINNFEPIICVKIKKWTQICEFNHIRHVKELEPEERDFHQNEYSEWLTRRRQLVQNTDLNKEYEKLTEKTNYRKDEILECLRKNDWTFSRSADDIGYAADYVAELEFRSDYNGEPFYHKPYKMAPELSDEVEIHLKKLTDKGIIEQTNSSFNTPILAVRKPNGSLRIVQNYAATLNKYLNLPLYPIPNGRNILNEISKFIDKIKNDYKEDVCLTTVDVTSGFHVISQRKSHRKYLSFTHKNTQYQFKKMSQGEKGSPSNFTFLMDKFFSNLNTEKSRTFLYVDDIVQVSCKSESIEAIDKLLFELGKYNFFIRPDKCSFNMNVTNFLGYKVDKTGFQSIAKKLEKIAKYPVPETLKEAYTFAGIIVYYIQFIPRLMVLASPLHKLIGLGKNFKMTDEARDGVKKIKELASKECHLYHLDYSRSIFIVSDCSLRGIGGAIGNADIRNGKLYNIQISSYTSRSLDLQETLLSSKAREIIGASFCIQQFSDLIPENQHFYLITDHLSMQTIFQGSVHGRTSTFTKIRQAVALILEKHCTFIYLSNKHELVKVVDGLSRDPSFYKENVKIYESELGIKNIEFVKDCNNIERNVHFPTPVINREKIIKAQKNDEKLTEIREKLEKMRENEILLIGQDEYKLKNDLLYRMNRHLIDCIIIPEELAYELVEFLHNFREHAGKERLILFINKLEIFITKKYKLVNAVLKNCLWCQYRRPEPPSESKLKETFHLRPSLQPFSNLRCDLVDLTKIGKLNDSKVKYLLTFMCTFSRYMDCEVLPDKKSETVANAIGLICMKYGVFGRSELTMDLGTEFTAESLTRQLQETSICKLHISGLNPKSNAIERCHREFKRILQLKMRLKLPFEHKIRLSVYTYNHLEQKNLFNKSPFNIVYGFEPDFLGLYFDAKESEEQKDNFDLEPENETPAWINHLLKIHTEIAHRRYQLNKATSEDIIEKNEFIQENDLVLSKFGFNKKDCKKLQTSWKGPFIVRKISKNSLTLECIFSSHLFTRNINLVKKLHLGEKELQMLRERKFIVKNNMFFEYNEDQKNNTVTMKDVFEL